MEEIHSTREIYCRACQKQVEFYKSERVAWLACYWCGYYKWFSPDEIS